MWIIRPKTKAGFIAWYLLFLAAVVWGLTTGRIRGAGVIGQENAWVLTYLTLGAWLGYGIALIGKGEAGCLAFLRIFAVIYVLQVIGYLYLRGFNWVLFLPVMLAATVALLALGRWATDRVPKECAECWKPASYRLSTKYEQPTWLCREHFMSKLEEAFAAYQGHFVVAGPPPTIADRAGQYIFYEPKDMANDSYPEADIASVDSLLSRLLDDLPESVVAVSIPADAVKEIGRFDDQPLFTQEISSITGTPLDLQGLLALMSSTARIFDRLGCQFRMNMPYADRGIYLWHDYV